ncbi:MAG: peptidase C1A papain [Chitinophagaceae bacterium]|nr:peptidase C1A papain [Chitinophagaceae bacterium]
MPIRMTDDPVDPNQRDDSGGGGRRGPNLPGGGGGLGALLPMILGLFGGKGGKGGIIILLVLAAGAFFLFKGKGCNVGDIAKLATGGMLDPAQFEKAKIYEPLADDPNRPALPESANLQQFAPSVGNQGAQGSCVAWSSAYAARTILESARSGNDPDNVRFSPSFLYNQIGLDGCQGSYIIRAMEFMTQRGSVPYNDFAYDEQDCTRQPGQQLLSNATQFKMHGFNRLSLGDRNDAIDLHAIKENLAQGAPVVIGMMVGQSFMQSMKGQDVWQPESGDENMMGFGGHAMCVVGYDDTKYSGAFLLMNSWGPEWGNNGFAWVNYNDFNTYVREAYGVDPMHSKSASTPLSCEIGLVQVEYQGNKTVTGDYISLRSAGNNKFETISPVAMGSKFKMEVKNNTECYIYVFGKETDGSSYTLFPYPTREDPTKTRYSAFCGITGYRLFPKDKSMTPDSIGTRDVMAVVISKEELDWNAINQQISQNPQMDYGYRVIVALGAPRIERNPVRFQSTGKGTIQFSASITNDVPVVCIVEIDKN